MLRYSNRPRRPRRKATAKALAHRAPNWRQLFTSRWTIDVVVLGLATVTAARLVSAAIAHPPPVATPGDIVPIEQAANWMGSVGVVQAHNLSGVFAPSGGACELDIHRMAQTGGSFTVLAVRPDGVMLSWAGGPTATPEHACAGGQTGILVSDADYRSLLMRVPVDEQFAGFLKG